MTSRARLVKVVAVAGATCAGIGAVAAGAGSAAMSSLAATAAVGHASTPSNIAVPTSASNKRASARDAERLLGLAMLPPGGTRLSAEPRGDDRLLVMPPREPRAQLIDRYDWWRGPATFKSVVAFLRSHPPAGTDPAGFGHGSGPGVPANQMLSYSFPAIAGVISARALTFYSVALRGGGTGIRVDAQETWIVSRPASEKVPARVHEVEVMSARPGRAPILTRSVTGPAKVRRIISLLDQMQIVQPGAYSCPLLQPGQPVVTFDFRATAGGPVLAEASLTDYGFDSGPCDAVSFSIHGHPQKPLIGGNFLGQVQRLLGVRFR